MDRDVLDFYDRHPINEQQVLAGATARGGLRDRLAADDLFEFDQDHYGGVGAVDVLARRAGITRGSRVLDVCAGLGGPARFLASRRECRVVALELNASRAAGAVRLTERVGLARRVIVVRGDAERLPFARGSFDACISQEGLLHVSDKPAALADCYRVLRPAGRLAFTDWVARTRLGEREREQLRTWMAAVTLQTLDGYRGLLGAAGFVGVEAEDLTDDWRPILRHRLTMYRSLRPGIVTRFGEEWYREYEQLYTFFVGLIEAGKLGGGRFSATR